MTQWKTAELKALASALRSFQSEADILAFLRDLCTLDELQELAARWQVAKLLVTGKSYREIAKKTKVSTTTITRIAYWLEHGEGGYKTALAKRKK